MTGPTGAGVRDGLPSAQDPASPAVHSRREGAEVPPRSKQQVPGRSGSGASRPDRSGWSNAAFPNRLPCRPRASRTRCRTLFCERSRRRESASPPPASVPRRAAVTVHPVRVCPQLREQPRRPGHPDLSIPARGSGRGDCRGSWREPAWACCRRPACSSCRAGSRSVLPTLSHRGRSLPGPRPIPHPFHVSP